MNHRLQLFDIPESLAVTVGSFLVEGYASGNNLLVVAKPRHRDAILAELHAKGCFNPQVDGGQRLVAMDAGEVLRRIERQGRVDADLFRGTIRPLIQRLAGTGVLRIYTEVTELLAEQDDFAEAMRVEAMWNALLLEVPFTLMCGYSSAHFTGPTSKPALRDLCRSHSHVTATTEDTLGSWLLAGT